MPSCNNSSTSRRASRKKSSGASLPSLCSMSSSARRERTDGPPCWQRAGPPAWRLFPRVRATRAEAGADAEVVFLFSSTLSMRPFILFAFGLQVLFGTTCMMQTVSAEEPAPAAALQSRAIDPSAAGGCAGHATQTKQEPSPNADFPCIHHCLAQATSRVVSDNGLRVPACPPAILPPGIDLPATGAEEILHPSPALSGSAAPPGTETIVLLQ